MVSFTITVVKKKLFSKLLIKLNKYFFEIQINRNRFYVSLRSLIKATETNLDIKEANYGSSSVE